MTTAGINLKCNMKKCFKDTNDFLMQMNNVAMVETPGIA